MVEVARKIVHSAVINYIKTKHKLTYSQLGESIGVHKSHIHKVSKCVSPLSDKKFDLLCKVWTVDVTEIVKKMELDDLQVLRWKTLKKIIEIKKISIDEIHAKTGIELFDLNLIMRGEMELTDEYVRKISEVIDIEPYIVAEGHVEIVFNMIKNGLWYLNFDRSAIETIFKYLERQM